MKEKIAKNFSLKMASVVFAFLAWLSVTNIANPWKTETQDVVVEIVGADVLEPPISPMRSTARGRRQ